MMNTDKHPHDIVKARNRILAEIGPNVVLVAVSKGQPDDRVDRVLKTGQRVFGENRVQEAHTRWHDRRDGLQDLRLHMIGPLQTNKAEDAVRLFDVIETMDRPKLLQAMVRAVEKTGASPPELMIQVNTGNEAQKSGIHVEMLPAFLDEVCNTWPGKVSGLMCIPPANEPAAPHFALLKAFADRYGLAQVSMGMSRDYVLAARLGATHIRVGTALFGSRNLRQTGQIHEKHARA